jgi:hypothetical protein
MGAERLGLDGECSGWTDREDDKSGRSESFQDALPARKGGDVNCYLDVVGGLVCLFDLKGSGQRNAEGSDRRQILNGRKSSPSINVTESVSWKRGMPSS